MVLKLLRRGRRRVRSLQRRKRRLSARRHMAGLSVSRPPVRAGRSGTCMCSATGGVMVRVARAAGPRRWRCSLAGGGSGCGLGRAAARSTPRVARSRPAAGGPRASPPRPRWAFQEAYRVEGNGVFVGGIGRTFPVDTTRWYWSLSSITLPVDERPPGMSYPRGGGSTKRWPWKLSPRDGGRGRLAQGGAGRSALDQQPFGFRRRVLFRRAAGTIVQAVVGQGPLERAGFAPWCTHPHLALLGRGEDDQAWPWGGSASPRRSARRSGSRRGRAGRRPGWPWCRFRRPTASRCRRRRRAASPPTGRTRRHPCAWVTGFGSGAYSLKLVNGTRQRLAGPVQRRQCGEATLRMLVTGAPPNCGGDSMPQRAMASSRSPSGPGRTIGAGWSRKIPVCGAGLPARLRSVPTRSRIASRFEWWL